MRGQRLRLFAITASYQSRYSHTDKTGGRDKKKRHQAKEQEAGEERGRATHTHTHTHTHRERERERERCAAALYVNDVWHARLSGG